MKYTQTPKFKKIILETKKYKLYPTYRALLNYYTNKPKYYFNHSPFITAIIQDDIKTLINILRRVKTNTIIHKEQRINNFKQFYLLQ